MSIIPEYECVQNQDPNHCKTCQVPLEATDFVDPDLEECNRCYAAVAAEAAQAARFPAEPYRKD